PAAAFDLPPGQLDPNTGEHVAPAAAAPAQQLTLPPQLQTPQATNPLLRIAQGLHSVAQGGSMYGAVTGQPDDPQSKQQATLRAQYNALIGAGLTHQQAVAAVLDPEAGKLILAQQFGPKTLTSLGEGYVTDKNGNV